MTDTLPAHVRVAIVGTGFAGLGMAIRLKQQPASTTSSCSSARDDVGGTWRDNTYPGCAVRRALAPVLVLVRAQPRLDAARSRRRPEIRRLPAALRRRLRRPPPHPLRATRSQRRDVGRRRAALARRDLDRARSRPQILVAGTGGLSEPSIPDLPGPRALRGHGLPLRRSGTTTTTCGRARRGRRHRRVGHPVRPAASSPRSRELQRLPAHAAVGHAPARPRDRRRCEQARATSASRRPAAPCARAIYWGREALRARVHATRALVQRVPERIARRHLAQAGARPRAARASSRRATASAASAC